MAKVSDSQRQNLTKVYEAVIDMMNLSADLVDAANDLENSIEGLSKKDNFDSMEPELKNSILQTLSDIIELGYSKIADRVNEIQKRFKIRHVKGQRKDKLFKKD
jgi:hypothetical protein